MSHDLLPVGDGVRLAFCPFSLFLPNALQQAVPTQRDHVEIGAPIVEPVPVLVINDHAGRRLSQLILHDHTVHKDHGAFAKRGFGVDGGRPLHPVTDPSVSGKPLEIFVINFREQSSVDAGQWDALSHELGYRANGP